MAEKSLIRSWRGKAATFVEDTRDGTIIVTVDDERIEMPASEWEGLPSHQGDVPTNFNKPPSET